jgi:hypothetical protein
MGLFRAAITAFSNARDGLFAIFERAVYSACAGVDRTSCAAGLTCDTGLGTCLGNGGEETKPCVLGTTTCLCVPQVLGGGFCQDRQSSVYDAESESGRLLSIAHQMEVAVEDASERGTFYAQSWVTQRFLSNTTRTVRDFDPARADGVGNDYAPADDTGDFQRSKVLLWGRPGFAGIGKTGQDAKLYFAYVDMPQYEAQGHFAWQPHYFTGLAGGVPQFSAHESDAAALDLSAGAGDTFESVDISYLMSVVYVPALQRWVMLYGGDLQGRTLSYFTGAASSQVQRDPDGSIVARVARQPWGPWSQPLKVFGGGDPTVNPPVPGSQYASGGIFYSPNCRGECAPHEGFPQPLDPGFLYAPVVQDSWIINHGPGQADLYWHVSNWNPYGILLMHTRIDAPVGP